MAFKEGILLTIESWTVFQEDDAKKLSNFQLSGVYTEGHVSKHF